MASSATTASSTGATPSRDPYIDFIRAFSLLVVVAWHWVFTIIIWEDDGPHATNPLGFTSGTWIATWLLQVMPLFFYVGGYAHLQSWNKASAQGQTFGAFTWRRLKMLAVPALAVVGVWVALGASLNQVYGWEWIGRAVLLVVSPMWFLGVYLMLIAILPIMMRLHQRFDTVVLVALAGMAGAIDIARFRYDLETLALVNMILVWGLCHQLGFFYRRIVDASSTVNWSLLLAGLFGLVGLVGSGLYPGSMVGVPGEASNMAPPTLCIVALVVFQAGVIEILRPTIQARLGRPRWSQVSGVVNRVSLPLFLFHSTGMALHRAVMYLLAGERNEATEPTLGWWLYRPFAFIGPLLFTLPVIYLFGRQWFKRDRRTPAALPEPHVP